MTRESGAKAQAEDDDRGYELGVVSRRSAVIGVAIVSKKVRPAAVSLIDSS